MEDNKLQNQMLKPCTPQDIWQVYYADIFTLIHELSNMFVKYHVDCEELDNLLSFMREFMRSPEMTTQYDSAILSSLHAVHSEMETNADSFGKELWTLRKLYSRISNMNKPMARQRALQARNLSEYGVLMNRIYSGEQTI